MLTMQKPERRPLKWKLTYSYWGVIILTLLLMQFLLMTAITSNLLQNEGPSPVQAGEMACTITYFLSNDLVEEIIDYSKLNAKLNQLLLLPWQNILSNYNNKVLNLNLRFEPDLNKVVIINTDGMVIAASDPVRFVHGSDFDFFNSSLCRELADNAFAVQVDISEEGTLTGYDEDNAIYIGVYPSFGMDQNAEYVICVMLTPVPGDKFFQIILFLAASTILVLAISLISGLIAGFFGFRTAKILTKPVEELTMASKRVAEGKLDQKIHITSNDEIGELAHHFNKMASNLVQMMSDLENKNNQVGMLLAEKKELTAKISHELRTPLAVLKGHIESLLMQENASSHDINECLSVIQKETETLNSLINDLFELSRLETHELKLKKEKIPVDDFIERCVKKLGPLAWEQKIALKTQLKADTFSIYADAQRFEQILRNLVYNALRHTPEGGLVMIGTVEQPEHIRIEVKDTGIGISQENIPHIFERFYRAENARTSFAAGSGLGLAIVKELVLLHGGTIGVESKETEGSLFWFTIPKAK
jgi:signal transduction histidine kinase